MNERIKMIGLVCALAAVGAGLYWYLNRGYGETSEQGYAYAMALFSACNQKDRQKLEKISQLIEQDLEKGKLDGREAAWLGSIIASGLRGNWQAASREVRQLMKDQVRPAPP